MGLLVLSVGLEQNGGEFSSQNSKPFLSDLSIIRVNKSFYIG